MASKMSPDAEMKGILVLASLNTVRKDGITHLLEEAGTFLPDQWYPVVRVRKMLDEVVVWRKALDASFDLVSLGAAVTQSVPIPPHWTSLEEVLQNYGTYHLQFYRNTGLDWLIKAETAGGPAGGPAGGAAGEHAIKMRFRMNFPDLFMYGWMQGFARRLLPKGTPFMILFDDQVTRIDFGGDETVVWVKWNEGAK